MKPGVAANPGILYATLAYTCWGLFPLYFHLLSKVGAFEVVVHRTLWSLLFLLGVLLVQRRWRWLIEVRKQPRVLAAFAASALLLAVNWVTYVWAVTNDHVLDSSLGYFMLPLVNVAIGYFLLHERPRRGQWLAVVVAACGVSWLTIQGGHPPWVALSLALSFGFYGLLRKVARLGALEGLTLETLLLSPLALAVLGVLTWQGRSALVTADGLTLALLVLAGPLTALPLLLFAGGARRIALTTLGVLQYISPSLQLVLGVWLYHEPFVPLRLLGFALIWLALLVYSAEGWWFARTRAAQRLSPASAGSA